jgi:hypothetical protein
MPPGLPPAALILYIPFAVIMHVVGYAALREVRPKRRQPEELRHPSEEQGEDRGEQ